MNYIKSTIITILVITTLQQSTAANDVPSYSIQKNYMFSIVPYIQFHRYSAENRLTSTSFEGGIRAGKHLTDWFYIEAGAGVIPSFKTTEKTASLIIYSLTTHYKIPYTTFFSKTSNVSLTIGVEGKQSTQFYPLCIYSGVCIDFNPNAENTTKATIKKHTYDLSVGLGIENKIYLESKKIIPQPTLLKITKLEPVPTPKKTIETPQKKHVRLIAGNFNTLKAATLLEVKFANKNIASYILYPNSKNKTYRVQLGYFKNKQNAISYQKRLAKQGYKTHID